MDTILPSQQSLKPNMLHSPSISTASLFHRTSLSTTFVGLQSNKKGSSSLRQKSTKTRRCTAHISMSAYNQDTQERAIEGDAMSMLETNKEFKILPGQAYPFGVSEIGTELIFQYFHNMQTQ
ncbi:Isoamylase 3 chloroplastic [Bienertia sinuspersici]